MKLISTILLWIVGIILIFTFLFAVVLFKTSIKRSDSLPSLAETEGARSEYIDVMQKSADWFNAQSIEELSINSFDGYALKAQFLKAPQVLDGTGDAKGTIIMMHGYHSAPLRDFALIHEYFHNEGYNVLLPYQRAHWKSEGEYITFGVKERYDCRDWALKMSKNDPQTPIWLMGISMGCATVTYATGLDLPKQVKGVIADCGFTRPYDMMKVTVNRDYHMPSGLILFWGNTISKIKADFDFKAYSTKMAFERNTLPILFVHGKNDTYVPFYMSEESFNACHAPKEFLKTSADHAMSFLVDGELYKKALREFIKKYS